jgi:hypothetical protein
MVISVVCSEKVSERPKSDIQGFALHVAFVLFPDLPVSRSFLNNDQGQPLFAISTGFLDILGGI